MSGSVPRFAHLREGEEMTMLGEEYPFLLSEYAWMERIVVSDGTSLEQQVCWERGLDHKQKLGTRNLTGFMAKEIYLRQYCHTIFMSSIGGTLH